LDSITNSAFGFSFDEVDYAIIFAYLLYFIWFLVIFNLNKRNLKRLSKWPSAMATVTATSFLQETRKNEQTKKDVEMYCPCVSFEYQYGGNTYTSNEYSRYAIWVQNKKRSDDIVKRHTVGKQVTCFVNPEQPDVAHIELGIDSIKRFLRLLLIVLLTSPLMICLGIFLNHSNF
jgi:hypothetical protein